MAALAAVVIGISRLALGMHSPAEVVIGAGVGLRAPGAAAARRARHRRTSTGGASRCIAVAVVVMFHGLHLPAEAHIRSTAWRFAHVLAVCQSAEVRL